MPRDDPVVDRPARRRELARFRRIHRRLLWQERPTPVQRLRLLVHRCLLRPVRVVRHSTVMLARHGDAVRRERGVPRWRQLATMCRLGLLHEHPPELYYRYRLFDPERRGRGPSYLHWREHNRMLAELHRRHGASQADALDDKRAFARWCAAHVLPTPVIVARCEQGASVEGPFELPSGDLFTKPATDRGGAGARAWQHLGDGRYRDGDGLVLDREGLRRYLEEQATRGPHLLQRRLANHPSLAALTSGGLCSARLVTGRPPGGDPVLLFSNLGMPVGGASVDNFHAGGLCAVVDPDTGTLGRAVRVFEEECLISYTHHPDGGGRIEGAVLPHWECTVDLVLRAHRAADEVAFVGWDVALTEDGPLLLEANPVWDAGMPQIPGGRPLGETVYVCWLLDHLGRDPRRRGPTGAAATGEQLTRT